MFSCIVPQVRQSSRYCYLSSSVEVLAIWQIANNQIGLFFWLFQSERTTIVVSAQLCEGDVVDITFDDLVETSPERYR